MDIFRAKEDGNSDEDHLTKKLKEDSENVFSSQDINFQNTESNPKLSLRSGKSLSLKSNTSVENTRMSKENIPVLHNPSLDMFAPSDVRSSNAGKAKENKPVLHAPSLDMFAPSGVRSSKTANVSVLNQSDVSPSCEDMFGSGSSKLSNGKTVEKTYEIPSTSNQPVKMSKIIFEDKNDEFSFPTRKRTNKPSLHNDVNDEFSFSANKKRCKVQEQPTDEDDEFSFSSSKNASNKRNRQSNPDIFASGETLHDSSSVAGPSKLSNPRNFEEKDEIDCRRSKQITSDDLFTFPEESLAKKKRYKESLICANDSSPEVQIALFSKGVTDSHATSSLQNKVQPAINMDVYEEEKNLVTYSKNMSSTSIPKKVSTVQYNT